MKIVIQRVSKASVKANKKIVGQVGQGLLLLVGVGKEDIKNQKAKIKNLANKVFNLRIFGDEKHKMNLSVLDVKGEILIVPQFTLYANCSEGNRPYFGQAAKPEIAKGLLRKFIIELKKAGLKVEKGQFGAKMEVELFNDGPVTIILESKKLKVQK